MRKEEYCMKKTFKNAVFLLAVIISVSAVFGGCDLSRKLQGIEFKFQSKIENAVQLSFDMHLNISSESGSNDIDISCYKKGEEYAYTFVNRDNANLKHRHLFADNCLYEFVTNTTMHVGSYYTYENVPYTKDENLLYAVTQNIMLATYATLFTTGKKDRVGDAEAYRYDFEHKGNQYSLWYDDVNLIKISATFNSEDKNGTVTSETYSAVFDNYLFENVPDAPFLRPAATNDAIYVESVIPFEDWMGIINKFDSRALNWL